MGNQAERWPRLQEYQAAIIEAEADFRDEELRGLRVQRHPSLSWVAWPRAGNFGVVFKVEGDAVAYAVKVFYYPQPDRELRYQLIDEHLRGIPMPKRLVSFAYQKAGIRVSDQAYPTLRMEWAYGEPLDTYLDQHLNASASIDNRMFFEEWVATMHELKRSALAHGDLQHKNILVQADKTFRLVDYDGMFVPSMRRHRLTACEAGVSAYQHPERKNGISRFDERIDDFSALVILLTLACVDADLWKRYHEDGRLLLSEEDLSQPGESALLTELSARKGPVGTLASLIRANAGQGIDQVPSFGTVIRELGMEWPDGAGEAAGAIGSATVQPPGSPRVRDATAAEVRPPTYTQRQVARLLAAGKTAEEISSALGLLPATVNEYVRILGPTPDGEGAAPPVADASTPTPPAAEVTSRSPAPQPVLSPRQQQVLELLRAGLGPEQIAARLQILPRTVNSHLSAIRAVVGNDEISRLISQAKPSPPEPVPAKPPVPKPVRPASPPRARTTPSRTASAPPAKPRQTEQKPVATRPQPARPQPARPQPARPPAMRTSPPVLHQAAPPAKRRSAGRTLATTILAIFIILFIIGVLQSLVH